MQPKATRGVEIPSNGAMKALLLVLAVFEAVTIKPAVPDAVGSSGEDGRNGFLKVYNVTLKRCIRYAYRMPETQIVGGPKWVDEVRYDINAKAAEPIAEPELLTMLQPVLANRFMLRLHRETRMMDGYALTIAKSGIKAPVSDPNRRSGADGGRGRIDTVATPMGELLIRLSELLERPVADMTRDTRRFDFHLRWTPDTAAAGGEVSVSAGPSIFTALEEQLGLKLVARKVPAEVLVVDHAELPTDN